MSTISVLPTIINFKLVQKTDNMIEFVIETNGKADDITNDSVRLFIKTNYGGVTKVDRTNAPGAHSDPTNGKTQFQLTKTDLVGTPTTALNTWVYELHRIFGGTNDDIVYLAGNVELYPAL
jgi:hypothetical protein